MTSTSAVKLIDYIADTSGANLNTTPAFQRGLVWDRTRSKDFIKSAIEYGVIHQPFIWCHAELNTSGYKWELLDGKQRTHTIQMALEKREFFSGLTDADISKLQNVNLFKLQMSLKSFEEKIAYFRLINSSGTRMEMLDIFYSQRKMYPALDMLYDYHEKYGVGGQPQKWRKHLLHSVCFSMSTEQSLLNVYKSLLSCTLEEVEDKAKLAVHLFSALRVKVENNKVLFRYLKENLGSMFIGRLLNKGVTISYITTNIDALLKSFTLLVTALTEDTTIVRRNDSLVGEVDEALSWVPTLTLRKKPPVSIMNHTDSVFNQADHVIPLAQGGTNHVTNYQSIPLGENLSKGARL
ncbi:hypothetical protein CCP3SC1AL1_2120008 [Gammaproteobacteria bacterium]